MMLGVLLLLHECVKVRDEVVDVAEQVIKGGVLDRRHVRAGMLGGRHLGVPACPAGRVGRRCYGRYGRRLAAGPPGAASAPLGPHRGPAANRCYSWGGGAPRPPGLLPGRAGGGQGLGLVRRAGGLPVWLGGAVVVRPAGQGGGRVASGAVGAWWELGGRGLERA